MISVISLFGGFLRICFICANEKKRGIMRETSAGKRRTQASILVEGGGTRRTLYDPVTPLPTRVTEGVAPRTHSTIGSFADPHTNPWNRSHGYIRRRYPKSAHRKAARRIASRDGRNGENRRRNGSDLGATPSVTRVECGITGLSGISARHLPLLIGRLIYAHVLLPHHGFPFAQVEFIFLFLMILL